MGLARLTIWVSSITAPRQNGISLPRILASKMIKIDFAFDTPYGRFADALHLPDDHGLSDEQIEALKVERRDNWLAIVTAPSVESPPESEV